MTKAMDFFKAMQTHPSVIPRKRVKKSASVKEDARARMKMAVKVLERAEKELPGFDKRDRQSNLMDLDSLNEGEIVMDWAKLLRAPAFDFAHDLHGIRRHMDRRQWPGKLTDCFLPRCARQGVK